MGLMDILNGMQHGPRGQRQFNQRQQQRRNVAAHDGPDWALGVQGTQALRWKPAARNDQPHRRAHIASGCQSGRQ